MTFRKIEEDIACFCVHASLQLGRVKERLRDSKSVAYVPLCIRIQFLSRLACASHQITPSDLAWSISMHVCVTVCQPEPYVCSLTAHTTDVNRSHGTETHLAWSWIVNWLRGPSSHNHFCVFITIAPEVSMPCLVRSVGGNFFCIAACLSLVAACMPRIFRFCRRKRRWRCWLVAPAAAICGHKSASECCPIIVVVPFSCHGLHLLSEILKRKVFCQKAECACTLLGVCALHTRTGVNGEVNFFFSW